MKFINKMKNKKKIFFSFPDFKLESIINKEFGNIFNIIKNHLIINEIDYSIFGLNKDMKVFSDKKMIFIEAGINEKNLTGHNDIDSVNDDLSKNISNLSEKLTDFDTKKVYVKKDGHGIFFCFNNQIPSIQKENIAKQEIINSSLNNGLSHLTLLFTDEIDIDNAAAVLRYFIDLLKESGISPDYFRIGVVVDNTAASVEISV